MKPDDHLTNDDPVSPGDAFESPREESIVKTDPLVDDEGDDDLFNEIDPSHDIDLGRAHAQGNLPPSRSQSWPAIAGAMLLVLWGGLYIGTYSGGFNGDVFSETANYAPVASAPMDPAKAQIALGEKLFSANCALCHQPTGLGIAGQYPPLVGSEWVVGDAPKRLQQILLHGIAGTIHVKGGVYNNNMPAWNATFTDKQIAGILSYVRQNWGNSAPPVTEADMTLARKETASRTDAWSEAELLAIPAGASSGPAAAGPAPAGSSAAPTANPPAAAPGNDKPAAAPFGQGPAAAPPPPKP